MKNILDLFQALGFIIGATVISVILTTIPIWISWNAVVPSIFSLREISFVDALILSVLCSSLFKHSTTTTKTK